MKKVALFLADGFEEVEALTVVDYLRRANIEVCTVSIHNKEIVDGAHGIRVFADSKLSVFQTDGWDALIFPGGMPGTRHLYENAEVLKLVQEANQKGKLLAAICAAPLVLYHADVLKDKTVTSYPSVKEQLKNVNYVEDKVVLDGNILTSRSAATAVDFALKLIECLLSKEESDKVAAAILHQ